jgi:hypothetical protein
LLINRDALMSGDVDMAIGGEEANSETAKGGLVGQKRLMISVPTPSLWPVGLVQAAQISSI